MGHRLDYLKSIPNPRYNPVWPEGTKQPLTKALAEYFFTLLATSETSLIKLLEAHPELPPWWQLNSWRTKRPWFAQAWREATQAQATFLVQRSIDLYHDTDNDNAHAQRVKFDIIKWLAAKFHPGEYGDKPAEQPHTTTVNVGIAISPERLTELRSKLENTRSQLKPKLELTERNGKKEH